MKIKTALLTLLLTLNLTALTVGETPKTVEISTANGGLVEDGSLWSSTTIKDKVFVMFYVDPDEKDVNEHYSQALKKAKDAKELDFQSIAIINLAATWKPNFIIEKILKNKQEEFPNTIYVKDKKSVLVKEWGVADNASNILIFSKDGRLLFYKSGKMNDEDIEKSFAIIKEHE
jgi:predicted transcriptional regulator